MRKMGYGVAGAALLIFLPALVMAANAPVAGPLATPAQIRAAHPGLRPVTKIVFEKRDGDNASRLLIVTLADDFLDILDGDSERLFDFKLKRAIHINRAAHRFNNVSLYASVGFRAFELNNRHVLGGALSAAKVASMPDSLKPFWAESELALTDQRGPPPATERQTAPDGAISFRFEGNEVVRLKPSAEPLSAEKQKLLSRALRYMVSIHPDIIDDIVKTGRLPATLAYTQLVGAAKSKVILTLRSADTTMLPFPLPDDFSLEVIEAGAGDSTASALNTVLPIIMQAQTGQYAGGPRTVAEYRKAIVDSMAIGATFQGLLLEFELLLQHGEPAVLQCADAPPVPHCYPLKEIVGVAAKDPRTSAFLEALQSDGKDSSRASELRRGIARTGLSDTAALDIMLANSLTNSPKRSEAFPFFISAIRANPYVAGFYKDLGDYFRFQYRTDLAWLCYDLGRALPDADATGNFRQIDQLEHDLETRNPTLF